MFRLYKAIIVRPYIYGGKEENYVVVAIHLKVAWREMCPCSKYLTFTLRPYWEWTRSCAMRGRRPAFGDTVRPVYAYIGGDLRNCTAFSCRRCLELFLRVLRLRFYIQPIIFRNETFYGFSIILTRKVMGVRPFACCDCGFECRRGHACVSLVSVVCYQVENSASGWSLVERSSTECGVSECDREVSIMRGLWHTVNCRATEKTKLWKAMYFFPQLWKMSHRHLL
jgi:hypothetical protein